MTPFEDGQCDSVDGSVLSYQSPVECSNECLQQSLCLGFLFSKLKGECVMIVQSGGEMICPDVSQTKWLKQRFLQP